MNQPVASSRPTLAIDIDDTLVTSEAALRANHNQKFPQVSVLGSFYTQDFTRANASTADIEAEVQRFFDSDEFYDLHPFKGAATAIDHLAAHYKLVLITARPQYTQARTMQWVDQHFPGSFASTRFVGTDEHQKTDLQQGKQEALRELGVTILIDDNLRHCEEAAAEGIQALLFGEYGWNRAASLAPGITRVRDWAEVEAQLL